MRNVAASSFLLGLLSLAPSLASAAQLDPSQTLTTDHWAGYLALVLFIAAVIVASLEEFTSLRKSKPVLVSAGLIWAIIGGIAISTGTTQAAEAAVRTNLLHYVELMLYMLVVMTYINTLQERGLFIALQARLSERNFSYRKLFWLSGTLTFILSPLLGNLSTTLLMGAAVMAITSDNRHFVSLGCINVVIAANAGGAFSPFGEITSLMLWLNNIENTSDALTLGLFSTLFLPALVNYLIPATILNFALPSGRIKGIKRTIQLRRGTKRIITLFLGSIATALFFRIFLHLPAVIGMLTGLSYLQFFGFFLKRTHKPPLDYIEGHSEPDRRKKLHDSKNPFDIFVSVARAEWDTLLFIYGILISVGGLAYLGYLTLSLDLMYSQWGTTLTHITAGATSAVLENIPTMHAILTQAPAMSQGEWLLLILTVGVGGSLLSIGSAAGIALMAQSKGKYTFFSHLKWTPIILIGYAASILTHLWINADLF